MTTIYCEEVPEARRLTHTAGLFGLDFPLRLEPFVFTMAGQLSPDYRGGFWKFFALCNGGFYMAPDSTGALAVSCENRFEGSLSADCRRRSKSEPPRRPNIEPGVEADFDRVGCG
jgi:hypothetical protein